MRTVGEPIIGRWGCLTPPFNCRWTSQRGGPSKAPPCAPCPSTGRTQDRAGHVGNKVAHPPVPSPEEALLEFCHQAKGNCDGYGGEDPSGVTLTAPPAMAPASTPAARIAAARIGGSTLLKATAPVAAASPPRSAVIPRSSAAAPTPPRTPSARARSRLSIRLPAGVA